MRIVQLQVFRRLLIGCAVCAAAQLFSAPLFSADDGAPRTNRIVSVYTLPNVPLAQAQNAKLPGSIQNDHKILLGSTGSDLWHGPGDPKDEFWMITDRGPNGQVKVDGKNRRTFWVPEFNPMILRVKTEGKEIRILETIPIVGQSGKPVTGLPNLKELDETP